MPENSTYDMSENEEPIEWDWNELKARDRKYRRDVATNGKDDGSYYGYEG